MQPRSARPNRRGVTELVALALLIGMVVATVGAAGAYVLVTEESRTEATKFAFEYYDQSGSALITYQAGPERVAGDIVVAGPNNAVSWAELAGDGPEEPVGVGDAVQVSDGNAYNASVESGDAFVVYEDTGVNRTELSTWTAG